MQADDRGPMLAEGYEPPTIEVIGRLHELTLQVCNPAVEFCDSG